MTLETLTAVFGWMTVLNSVIYAFTAVMVLFTGGWAARLQARLTGVPEGAWPEIFVRYLAGYKIAIIVLNLVPYLSLRIVGG